MPWALNLYNNSGHDAVIRFTEKDVLWRHASEVRIQKQIRDMKWVRDTASGGDIPVLNVVQGNVVANYYLRIFPLSQEFFEKNRSIEIYLQMEPNGELYAVKPTQRRPVATLEPQPEGFPIKPSSKSTDQ